MKTDPDSLAGSHAGNLHEHSESVSSMRVAGSQVQAGVYARITDSLVR